MMHNFIADVRKGGDLLKSLANDQRHLVNNTRSFTYKPQKGAKSNILTCKLCARVIFITVFTTGHPGSVIVPQYSSSKITVFVWGKNTVLKFLGNTQ